jgi:hypothetical protein
VTNFAFLAEHAVPVIPARHRYPVLLIGGHIDDDLRRECARKRVRLMPMPFTLGQLSDEVAGGRRLRRLAGIVTSDMMVTPAGFEAVGVRQVAGS